MTFTQTSLRICFVGVAGSLKFLFQRAIIAWMIVSMEPTGGIGALGVGALSVSIVVLAPSPAKARCVIAG